MNYTYEELKQMEIPLGKANDITGMKFGKLTALFRVKNKSSKSGWACECDCGNYTIVDQYDLRSSHTKSCGCGQGSIKDITGNRYGLLTAIEPTDKRDFGSVVWKVRCDCGEEFEASIDSLQIGDRTKCDNHQIKEMIGKTFGRLTVLSYAYSKNQKRYYLCQCECGNKAIVSGNDLNSNHKKSCGCINSIGEENIKNIFISNNYSYIQQITFDTCRFPDTNALARFDFYIPSEDCFLLEFDGPQHQEQTSGWNDEEYFIKTLNHDLYKNQWAYENEMPLKRIPYQYRDSLTIDDILSNKFLITPDTHPQYYPAPNSSYPYIIL